MGMIFSPLTAIAISDISNKKMAQASGLINVILQIGGSFGVAMFGTILARQTISHSAMYGEQVNQYSAAFRHTMMKQGSFAMKTGGGTFGKAAARAKALLIVFIRKQAFIQAVNDVFLLQHSWFC